MQDSSHRRVSTAGIVEENGRFLLALRKPGTSIGERWEFPGGKAEPGETPESALVREYEEELGVSIEVGPRLFEGSFLNKKQSYRLLAFSVRITGGEIALTEHSELRWAGVSELPAFAMADSDSLIRDFLLKR
jgi:8-oxo-dGTP diphosphatase